MNEHIEPLRSWWADNAQIAQISETYWDAYVELGNLIKQLAEAEAARQVEVVERTHTWSEPIKAAPVEEPAAQWALQRKLDPMPYVLNYGLPGEERVSASDPMRLRAIFKPMPQYEQDRSKYGSGFSRGRLVG